jgi:hypothetical protein
VNARFDSNRGFGAVYGVRALAGRVLSFEGGSKHSEIRGESAIDRLKPGLHTQFPSLACDIWELERSALKQFSAFAV